MVAAELHRSLGDLGPMPLAEFNLLVAGYVERAKRLQGED